MTNTWSHEAGSAESTNAEKPFQMLKDLIFNHNLWCPRRFRNEQSSRVLQTDGEERSCRTNQSSVPVQAGDNLEKACVGTLDDDVQHQTYHGHGVPVEKADPSPGRGRGPEGHQEGSEVQGSEVSGQTGHWKASESLQSSDSLEPRGVGMHPRGGVPSSPSWKRALLVHLPAMWRSLGKASVPSFQFNSGDRDNGPGGELSKVFACTEKPPRSQNAEGDNQPVAQGQSCDIKTKRVTWKDLAEAGIGEDDRPDASSKVEDADARPKSSVRIPGRGLHVGRQRHGRGGNGDSRRRLLSRGDSHDECRLAAGHGGISDGPGHGVCLSPGAGAHPGPVKMDDLECFESFEAHKTKSHDTKVRTTIRAELKHSAQILDCGLASKVASVAKMAAILLLTFSSNCEATWSLPGIQSFVQVPHWLGETQHAFLQDQNGWLPLPPGSELKGRKFHIGLVYPLNSCNYNLFSEDMQWSCKGVSLPRGVKIFLNQSLSGHFGTDIMEVYSPPRVTLEAELQNRKGHKPAWRIGQAFDLTNGFDFRDRQTRIEVLRHIRKWRPALIILCPPCTTFSPLRNLSNFKRDYDVVLDEEEEGLLHWEYSLQLAEEQDDANRAFLLEQPRGAKSWEHPRARRLRARRTVYEITIDMCAFQLRTKEGELARKPTMIVTNCYPLVKMLHKRCSGYHHHQPLLGGRAAAAAQYTKPFVRAILRGLRHHLQFHGVVFTQSEGHAAVEPLPQPLFHAVDSELRAWVQPLASYVLTESGFQEEFQVFATSMASSSTTHFPSNRILGGGSGRVSTLRRQPLPALDDDVEEPVMKNVSNQLRPIAESREVQQLAEAMKAKARKDGKLEVSADLRREIFRLHRNLGHPDQWTFLRALRHAQAKPEVIEWVRSEFRCPICESSRKPSLPRPGHLVRCMAFNEVVGVDVCYFDWKGNSYPLLNMLCWGTGLQIIERLQNVDAHETHQAILKSWFMPFEPPAILICDQGREFFGEEFSQRVMEQGVMVHFTDTNSPWQNSRTEKAGGIYKQKLHMVLDEVSAMTPQDLDLSLKETCISRNRAFSRSGFSPYQRAFGVNPRLLGSLLSDDILNPELLQVSASEDMQRSWRIREAAAMAWVKQQDIDSVRRSVKAATRSADLKPLSVGEWVFVWRSIPGFTGWSGPGVLLAISPSEKSMWVSLRGHLLKVSREHLRSATAEEHLGAELIKELSAEMLKDIKDGKIRQFHDLTKEPTPDQEKELRISTEPLDEDGPRPLPSIPEEPPQVPQIPPDDDDEISMAPTTPLTTPRDMALDQDEIPDDVMDPADDSTRAPSVAPADAMPSVPPSAVDSRRTSVDTRRNSITVDEGPGGELRAPMRGRGSVGARVQPYPFVGNPPPLPLPPRPSEPAEPGSFYLEVADFDGTRSRHLNWTNGPDGAVWWHDKRTGRSSLSALSNDGFRTEEAVGIFSQADLCIYMTKAKTSPGQVDFKSLSKKHREVFEKARIKEVQSLLDNKAIRILSVEESRAFRKEFPDYVLQSRYVDRWKPDGDKFSTLPQSYGSPDFEPTANNSGVSAKSRWCAVGWRDPLVHSIERSAPTPLSISICLFFQLSSTRRWAGRVKDAKTAFLQSLPTTRKRKLCCTMPNDWVFPNCTSEQLVMLETEVYGLVSGPAWWRKSFWKFFWIWVTESIHMTAVSSPSTAKTEVPMLQQKAFS